MKTASNFIIFIFISLTLISCGKQKSPTGGPIDKEPLEIVHIVPNNYGSLENKEITILFNKEIQRSTAISAFSFYPDIQNFDVDVDGSEVTISIKEKLQENSNYYLNISNILKDTRSNKLISATTYIFANGKLQDSRIYGDFIYSQKDDQKLKKKMMILDSDSLLVFKKTISGDNYNIDGLETKPYVIRTYIDKNNNGRYDTEKEPISNIITDSLKTQKYDIKLAYVDTSYVRFKSAKATYNNQVTVKLTEKIKSWDSINIISKVDSTKLDLLFATKKDEELFLITAKQDTLEYLITASNTLDYNENLLAMTSTKFKGQPEKNDTLAVEIVDSNPRNGISVKSKKPILSFNFSKIITEGNLFISLVETETKSDIPLNIVKINDFNIQLTPKIELKNFNSYSLTVLKKTSDVNGNQMVNDYKVDFLVTSK